MRAECQKDDEAEFGEEKRPRAQGGRGLMNVGRELLEREGRSLGAARRGQGLWALLQTQQQPKKRKL